MSKMKINNVEIKRHSNCPECEIEEHETKSRQVISRPPDRLKFRPFCDCKEECRGCPDILDRLGIKVTSSTCLFPPYLTKKISRTLPPDTDFALSPSLWNIINQSPNCACDVVANTVDTNISKNMGLTDKRDAIIAETHKAIETPKPVQTPSKPHVSKNVRMK